jgi:hypothetical protein
MSSALVDHRDISDTKTFHEFTLELTRQLQFIAKIVGAFLLFGLPYPASAQSLYLPQGTRHATLLDRLEIKMQTNGTLNVSAVKPTSRKLAAEAALAGDSLAGTGEINLSRTDRYNLETLLSDNSEWVNGDRSYMLSRKSIWNTIYKTKANFLEVNEKDFFLVVNPVLQFQLSSERNADAKRFVNTRGITLRGMISKRVGFYTLFTDNQERMPTYANELVKTLRAVPGEGFYKPFKTGAWDYLEGRGGITFNAAKYIDFRFAYDKNFIGNGYRSLLLSDFSNSALFLEIDTKIWKLDYQNIYMELNPQFVKSGDNLIDKKYATLHHLSINATKWLNVGLFEAVIFGRKNSLELSYLNPIIFLRVAEQQNGSPDNALVGFDFKANVAKRAQFYGQLMLDEFVLKEVKAGNGWWGNKFAVQLGGRYIDVFGIKNLDIQGELNFVRPFTYSHYDSSANYSHYNQPLAHPLGANFVEAIGIMKYQPSPKWTGSARVIAWKQGLDTGASSSGANIFKLYTLRNADYGYSLPSGVIAKGLNLQLLVSYEMKQNLFLDGAILVRNRNSESAAIASTKTSMFTLGLRLNMNRREYDY